MGRSWGISSCVMFCRLLFVLLSFFVWRLCFLSFLDLRILVTPLDSSSSSYNCVRYDKTIIVHNTNIRSIRSFLKVQIRNIGVPITINVHSSNKNNGTGKWLIFDLIKIEFLKIHFS
jgi:hypothetical protein